MHFKFLFLAIAKKIQKLIEEICEQKDKAPDKSMEYIDQLKDYRSKGNNI